MEGGKYNEDRWAMMSSTYPRGTLVEK